MASGPDIELKMSRSRSEVARFARGLEAATGIEFIGGR